MVSAVRRVGLGVRVHILFNICDVKNVWSVERKPTGKDSADTIELTKLAQQRIIRRFKIAISKADLGKLER